MFSSFNAFLQLVVTRRQLIISMARRELRNQYVGSFLGVFWTFIHPVVMIAVFWFVFSIGFKTKPMNDVPFVIWLTAGLAPWFIFSEIISGSTGIIVANAHLIKKTIFYPQILPLIKICASLVTHGVFLIVLLFLILFQGMPLSFWFLQGLYYLFGLIFLTLGISWMLSALNVFIRDVAQLVSVVLQVGFWVTPIFWDISMMPVKVQRVLKLNPVYYIIQGYRDSFIAHIPFWERPYDTLYFWCCACFMFVFGAFVFKKLKPQFSDVL